MVKRMVVMMDKLEEAVEIWVMKVEKVDMVVKEEVLMIIMVS